MGRLRIVCGKERRHEFLKNTIRYLSENPEIAGGMEPAAAAEYLLGGAEDSARGFLYRDRAHGYTLISVIEPSGRRTCGGEFAGKYFEWEGEVKHTKVAAPEKVSRREKATA